MPPATLSELEAALLQATITLGVAALCLLLYARFRKRYFLWWAVAWLLYVVRIGAIVGFLTTTRQHWLYTHQILTGLTGLALLWASIVFSQQRPWRWRYLGFAAFPVVWSYIAIYRLQNFLLAAGPAVLFLSLATLWTGWVFLRFRRRVGSHSAGYLAWVLILWGLHHLDYPLLRARGAWNPWGYYLDSLFVLATGAGIVLLVLEDLQRGLRTLAMLSGDLVRAGRRGDLIDALLTRPLDLPGVRGSALYVADAEGGGTFVRGVGACQGWTGTTPNGADRAALDRAVRTRQADVAPRWGRQRDGEAGPAYAAMLPIVSRDRSVGALVIVGDERDPFTALGDSFLLALGQQVGAALENADLYERLEARTDELQQLSRRMVRQHEEERRRISRELHDETAQVFSAVKMQLGIVREVSDATVAGRVDRVLALVDTGIRSIRRVTSDLRPPLLDDLGLLAALRALVSDFGERCAIAAALDVAGDLPPLGPDAELALFRALQEALSNVARHASASSVRVRLGVDDGAIVLDVEDDGCGFGSTENGGSAKMGITGMRERLIAVGGTLVLGSRAGGGARVEARIPLADAGIG